MQIEDRKSPYQLGFQDGSTMARDSGMAEEPVDGWDGSFINAVGYSAACELLGLDERVEALSRPGWSKQGRRALEQYRKGCINGARQKLESRTRKTKQSGPSVKLMEELGYRVHVEHERIVDIRTELDRLKDVAPVNGRSLYTGKTTSMVRARGGRTIVGVDIPGDFNTNLGWSAQSICHENDNFNRGEGLRIALQRVINMMADHGQDVPAQPIFEFQLFGPNDHQKQIVVERVYVSAADSDSAKKKLKAVTTKRLQRLIIGTPAQLNPHWFGGDAKLLKEVVRIY